MVGGERAVFLDRDGTINTVPFGSYVLERAQFHFAPLALDALAFLAKNFGGKIAICTNQSPVGRGWVMRSEIDAIHAWMVGCIEQAGGRIDGLYLCPHVPGEGCACRKPQPGLLHQAAREMDLDLSASCFVGDADSDVEAAWAAGIREIYWLRAPERALPDLHYTPVETLLDAALLIVSRQHQHQRPRR